MKQFKLIKTYPGGPKTIGLKIYGKNDCYQSNFLTEIVEYFYISIEKFDPTEFPEFWEELNTEFEILAFIRNSGNYKGVTFTKDDRGLFTTDFMQNNLTEEHCLGGGFDIHTVKRLPDGQIFKLGEVVRRHKDKDCENPNPDHRTISRFYVNENDNQLKFDTDYRDNRGYILNLFSKVDLKKKSISVEELIKIS
jgi:hypothetical protein